VLVWDLVSPSSKFLHPLTQGKDTNTKMLTTVMGGRIFIYYFIDLWLLSTLFFFFLFLILYNFFFFFLGWIYGAEFETNGSTFFYLLWRQDLKLMVQLSFFYCEGKIRPSVMTTHFSFFLSVIHNYMFWCACQQKLVMLVILFLFFYLLYHFIIFVKQNWLLCKKTQKLELSRFFVE
jgi:hypothetical protein